jgi:hypothetical protein
MQIIATEGEDITLIQEAYLYKGNKWGPKKLQNVPARGRERMGGGYNS